jgi:hypothetical protein
MSKAHQIALAVFERLQTIRRAAGYRTDLGARLYRGRTSISDETLPAAVITQGEDEIEAQAVTHKKSTGNEVICNVLLPMSIDIVAPAEHPDHPDDTAHAFVADIKRAVFSGDLTWGGLATHTRYMGRLFNPPEPGSNLITARVNIRIGYIEDLAKP